MSKSLSNDSRYYFGPSALIKKRVLLLKSSSANEWDFSVREDFSSRRLFVSTVVWSSDSYSKGLRPNDQILSINGIPVDQFNSFNEILNILRHSNELDLFILTMRIHSIDSVMYDWYNPMEERSTSPPPSTYLSPTAQLSYPERTVRMKVESGRKLGLVIRGGWEYGLGIFISGIDRGSLSEQKGLSVGDQILSVNGTDFRSLTHENAVDILRKSSQLTFHLRQMNKLLRPKHPSLSLPLRRRNSLGRKLSITDRSIRWNEYPLKLLSMIDHLDERNRLENVFNEYLKKKITIDQLIGDLSPLLTRLNQSNKNRFVENLRQILDENDLDHFDIYLLKDDLNRLKFSHQRLVDQCEYSTEKGKSRSLGHLNLPEENRIRRPSSLEIAQDRNCFDEYPRSFIDQQFNEMKIEEENLRPLNKSQMNLSEEENHFIEEFLQDYSSSYPITIHKVRRTLGIAIEGGRHDRIPLPRVVYIQPDGSAYLSSGLRVGDVLIGLNGYSMKGLTHRQSALAIASAFKDPHRSTMNLLVVQPNNEH